MLKVRQLYDKGAAAEEAEELVEHIQKHYRIYRLRTYETTGEHRYTCVYLEISVKM